MLSLLILSIRQALADATDMSARVWLPRIRNYPY